MEVSGRRSRWRYELNSTKKLLNFIRKDLCDDKRAYTCSTLPASHFVQTRQSLHLLLIQEDGLYNNRKTPTAPFMFGYSQLQWPWVERLSWNGNWGRQMSDNRRWRPFRTSPSLLRLHPPSDSVPWKTMLEGLQWRLDRKHGALMAGRPTIYTRYMTRIEVMIGYGYEIPWSKRCMMSLIKGYRKLSEVHGLSNNLYYELNGPMQISKAVESTGVNTCTAYSGTRWPIDRQKSHLNPRPPSHVYPFASRSVFSSPGPVQYGRPPISSMCGQVVLKSIISGA